MKYYWLIVLYFMYIFVENLKLVLLYLIVMLGWFLRIFDIFVVSCLGFLEDILIVKLVLRDFVKVSFVLLIFLKYVEYLINKIIYFMN